MGHESEGTWLAAETGENTAAPRTIAVVAGIRQPGAAHSAARKSETGGVISG